MKKYIITINKHNQVTIPATVRRALVLKPGDKVVFTIEGGKVHLSRTTLTLESAYGSVKPSRMPEDFEKLSCMAKDDKARKWI